MKAVTMLRYLVCLALLGLPSVAAAQSAARVYVVDFRAADGSNKIDQYIKLIRDETLGDVPYLVIDPRAVAVIADGLGGFAGQVRRGPALERHLHRVSVALRTDSDHGFDLSGASQLITQTLQGYVGYNAWEVYFLGSIKHADGEHKFQDGYPNDGFIYLRDSEFGYVDRLSDDAQATVRVHVFYADSGEFEAEHDRFMDLWVQQLWGAELVSFNGGIDKGTRPTPVDGTLDRDVTSSRIIRPGERPICETFDEETIQEVAYGTVEVTITNPCRANSMVVLRVLEQEFSAPADAQGTAKVLVRLNPGVNEIEARNPEGEGFSIVAEWAIQDVRDAIETEVADGKVTIRGYHPLREDGDLVSITNEAADRTWRVPVLSREWVLTGVPLDAGVNEFLVLQTDGSSTVPVYVRNDDRCGHSRNVSESRGLVTIRFRDNCLANQTLDLVYEGEIYSVNFNSAGRGEIRISLRQVVNRITYDLRGTERLIEVPVSAFSALLRVTLAWDANIDLDLYTTEPDGTLVNYSNKQGTWGELDIDNRGQMMGRKQENYVVELAQIPGDGRFEFMVENYARRSEVSSTAHCAGGEFETVPYTITIIDRGEVSTRQGAFDPFPCDSTAFARSEASRQVVHSYGD